MRVKAIFAALFLPVLGFGGCAGKYALVYDDLVVVSDFGGEDTGEFLRSNFGCTPRESKKSCGLKIEEKWGKAKFEEAVKTLREVGPDPLLGGKARREAIAEWDRYRRKHYKN